MKLIQIIFLLLLIVALCAIGYFDLTTAKEIDPIKFQYSDEMRINRGEVSTNQKISKSAPADPNIVGTTNQVENKGPASEQLVETQKKIEKSKEILAKEFDYGKNEPVKVESSLQKASILTALNDPGKYPERLSVAYLPAAFDLEAYKKDPNSYLNTIEPARVFQSAQPNEKVVSIERISEKFPVIKQGDKTILIVKALPDMPVTFTSFDLGRFENDLTTITI